MDRRVTAGLYPQLRLDLKGKVIEANRAAGELLTWFSAERSLARALASAREAGARSAELSVQGRLFSFAIQPEEDGFALFGREISEERHAMAVLRQEEARLRALMEAAPDAVMTVSAEGIIDFINHRGEAMFGFAPGALTGCAMETVIPEWRSAPAVGAILGRASRADGAITARRADGRVFPVEVNAGALDREGRLQVMAIVRDVTEREAAAEEIRALNRRLEEHVTQLTRLNGELESFSYSVSHDLRGPLRSIDGFTAIVLEEQGSRLDEEARGFLERVRSAAARMSDLIEGLLRLSRIARMELRHEEVDLSAIVESIADGLQREATGRAVEFSVEPGLRVRGDRALLTVALHNLVGNAWKFTARCPGGRIAFGRERRPDGDVYFVRDNGAGFEMAFAGKLFAPFERLHDPAEYPGTGIGLATVERVIRRHGGTIWAEGRPGAGAVFRFTLPL